MSSPNNPPNSHQTVCQRYIVCGRVQGVYFRASTRDEAVRLGLTGYARNLADGSVEVVACGERSALATLQRWLHEGPSLARVDTVDMAVIDPQEYSDFGVF